MDIFTSIFELLAHHTSRYLHHAFSYASLHKIERLHNCCCFSSVPLPYPDLTNFVFPTSFVRFGYESLCINYDVFRIPGNFILPASL